MLNSLPCPGVGVEWRVSTSAYQSHSWNCYGGSRSRRIFTVGIGLPVCESARVACWYSLMVEGTRRTKMPNQSNSNQTGSSTDPRRPNKIFRYKPLANKATDDPTPDYMNLLGMIFSMCGLMMKLKWAAWAAVYCSFISFANARSSEDTKQMFSSFLLSVSAVVMSYLQNPQPMAASW